MKVSELVISRTVLYYTPVYAVISQTVSSFRGFLLNFCVHLCVDSGFKMGLCVCLKSKKSPTRRHGVGLITQMSTTD
jgi:hypothetical protein